MLILCHIVVLQSTTQLYSINWIHQLLPPENVANILDTKSGNYTLYLETISKDERRSVNSVIVTNDTIQNRLAGFPDDAHTRS